MVIGTWNPGGIIYEEMNDEVCSYHSVDTVAYISDVLTLINNPFFEKGTDTLAIAATITLTNYSGPTKIGN